MWSIKVYLILLESIKAVVVVVVVVDVVLVVNVNVLVQKFVGSKKNVVQKIKGQKVWSKLGQ